MLYKGTELIASTTVTGDTLPIGGMIPWTSNTIPDNWLLCDGQAVSRTTYASLYAVVGTTYGTGDGSTTFNVPNIKGRTIVGRDSADTDFDVLGETRGSKFTEAHSHVYTNKYGNVNTGSVWASLSNYDNAQAPSTTPLSTQSFGTGNAGNIQPSIVENYIIKALQSSGVVATVVDDLTSTSATNALSANQGKILNTVESWTEVSSFSNSWVNYDDGTSFPKASYYKDRKRVYLKGLIKSGTMNQVAFTLPSGYRPLKTEIFAVDSNASHGSVYIGAGGTITPVAGTNAWITLNGISFRID